MDPLKLKTSPLPSSPELASPISLPPSPISLPPSPSLSQEVPLSDTKLSPPITITNGKRIDRNGFIYITVKGKPEERGFAQGFLLANRIVKFIRTYAFFIWTQYGRDITFFIQMIKDLFGNIVFEQYKEYYLEMDGIAKGVLDKITKLNSKEKEEYFSKGEIEENRILLPEDAYLDFENSTPSERAKKYNKDKKMSIPINYDIILLLNCIVSVEYVYPKLAQIFTANKSLKNSPFYDEYYKSMNTSPESPKSSTGFFNLFGIPQPQGASDRCSAFMAIGEDYTSDGKIVCAHITFDNFVVGQFDNIILYIDTAGSNSLQKKSYNILMQTFAGGIFSSTDFFVTSAQIMGTETTIGGFHAFELNAPACVRSRQAMQYAGTLDEYATYLSKNNSGDYANTWYIGHNVSKDSTGKPRPEIMRIELGLKYKHIQKKTKGYFIGFNACDDPRIRNLECSNDGYFDIRRHSGARRVALERKIKEFTKDLSRISDIEARLIISDHYDVYTGTENKCSRTICSHYDLDKREYMSQFDRPLPYQPRGAVDGKICTSNHCDDMQFIARWGNACGTDFKKDDFCDSRKQWDYQRAYLEDRLEQPWVVCSEVNFHTSKTIIDNAIKVYEFGSSGIGKMPNKSPMPSSPLSLGTPSSVLSPENKILPTSTPSPLPTPASAPAPAPTPIPAAAPTPEFTPQPPPPPPSAPAPAPIPAPTSEFTPLPPATAPPPPVPPIGAPAVPLPNDFDYDVGGSGSHKKNSYFDNDNDNDKEMKEFNKIFKKNNKKSYKLKNRNTKRNKKHDK